MVLWEAKSASGLIPRGTKSAADLVCGGPNLRGTKSAVTLGIESEARGYCLLKYE